MIAASDPPATSSGHLAEASALALRLVQAENALRTLTSGQADAVIDPDGRTYLLHPAQEHLRKCERRLEAVIESAADVVTVVNRGGEILSQNRAAVRLHGYESEKLVGRNLFSLVHADDLPRLYAAFFNVIDEFRPDATIEFRHQTQDGGHRLMEATMSKLRDVDPAAVVLIYREIARRELAHQAAVRREAVLEEALHAKDRHLAMISHELRTPLMPVLLGLDLLEEDASSTDAQTTLTMIRRNLGLQARLLEDLIDFATVDQHKLRLRPEVIDAHEAIRWVLEICQAEFETAQLEVALELRASESNVLADSLRLQQVMWNLIKNAIKFSPPGSTISIASANEVPGNLTLEIVDHGIGIDPELLPLVFDAFQQDEGSTANIHGSLGLGLFIAKRLATAMQGTLTAVSEGRGQGATFRLILKTSPPRMTMTTGGALVQASSRKRSPSPSTIKCLGDSRNLKQNLE